VQVWFPVLLVQYHDPDRDYLLLVSRVMIRVLDQTFVPTIAAAEPDARTFV
jgi:hypothetical protein